MSLDIKYVPNIKIFSINSSVVYYKYLMYKQSTYFGMTWTWFEKNLCNCFEIFSLPVYRIKILSYDFEIYSYVYIANLVSQLIDYIQNIITYILMERLIKSVLCLKLWIHQRFTNFIGIMTKYWLYFMSSINTCYYYLLI